MNHKKGCLRISSILASYIMDDLSPSDIDLIKDHLSQCDSCRREFAEIVDVLKTVNISVGKQDNDAMLNIETLEKMTSDDVKVALGNSPLGSLAGTWLTFIAIFIAVTSMIGYPLNSGIGMIVKLSSSGFLVLGLNTLLDLASNSRSTSIRLRY